MGGLDPVPETLTQVDAGIPAWADLEARPRHPLQPSAAPYYQPAIYGSDGRVLHRAVVTTRPPGIDSAEWKSWSRERRARAIARFESAQGAPSAGSTDAVAGDAGPSVPRPLVAAPWVGDDGHNSGNSGSAQADSTCQTPFSREACADVANIPGGNLSGPQTVSASQTDTLVLRTGGTGMTPSSYEGLVSLEECDPFPGQGGIANASPILPAPPSTPSPCGFPSFTGVSLRSL